VENREPKELVDRVSVGLQGVYCWARIINGQGQRITVRWVSKGRFVSKTELPVGSEDWCTWAHLVLRSDMIGPAWAGIFDEKGKLLQAIPFEITP